MKAPVLDAAHHDLPLADLGAQLLPRPALLLAGGLDPDGEILDELELHLLVSEEVARALLTLASFHRERDVPGGCGLFHRGAVHQPAEFLAGTAHAEDRLVHEDAPGLRRLGAAELALHRAR